MLDVSQDRFVVFDTETTGFDPEAGHKVIEIGAVVVMNGKITDETFHAFVDPQRDIPYEATEVHGMSRQDCVELGRGQTFKDIADDLIAFFDGQIVVAHNAKFDTDFLDYELSLLKKPPITSICKVIDSLGYANGIAPTKKNSLDQLAKRYGVNDFDRSLHGALLDSMILAKVFMAMRLSQQHNSIKDVLASSEKKKRVLNLSELVKPIPPSIALSLPVIEISQQDADLHKSYLTKMDSNLGW